MNVLKNAFKVYFKVKLMLKSERGHITIPRKCCYWLHAKGVTFNGGQEKIRFTNQMSKLVLESRPVKQDNKAVVILNEKDEVLGWIGRTLSARVTGLMSSGKATVRRWKKIGGFNGKTMGLMVEIEELICVR